MTISSVQNALGMNTPSTSTAGFICHDFRLIELSRMYRPEAETWKYELYSDKDNFELVEANTVIEAMKAASTEKPIYIRNINCRIPTIITRDKLSVLNEVVEQEALVAKDVASEESQPADSNVMEASSETKLEEVAG